MIKFVNSQVLVLFVLALLLAITPLLPSSLRPTYLYFIFNVLIIALGAEAGLLSVFSKPLEDRKQAQKLPLMPSEVLIPEKKEGSSIIGGGSASEQNEKKPKVVEEYASERIIISGVNNVDKMKKCPSMPSLFFIGGEDDAEEFLEEELEEAGVNGQELFAKAEAFIGNFYKQLKMQREESWTL